ncbi:MAG: 50S ribosomal protein L11 methyltransferase [Gammaproteobacteria bacterium]|nr:50S ribosomal protein L11 methyltransferase [Gammaproteobacteria bacterium]
MPDSWLQAQLEVPRDAIAGAEALLEALGALVSWTESANDEEIKLEPAPGAIPLWPEVRITALFPPDTSRTGLAAALKTGLGMETREVGFSVVQDRDWDADWRRQLKPLRFGKQLWICPVGQACPATDGISVILEPGLAFGTGTHPTTAMCLAWLDGIPLAGKRVLDYGCGSGILAIAALALGAERCVGIDIDPQALLASRDNALRNACSERLTLGKPADGPTETCAVIVANILSGPLVRLAPRLRHYAAPGTRIALSGILGAQSAEVVAAFRPWVQLELTAQQDDWVLLTGCVAD